jgi:hypothetical protein
MTAVVARRLPSPWPGAPAGGVAGRLAVAGPDPAQAPDPPSSVQHHRPDVPKVATPDRSPPARLE